MTSQTITAVSCAAIYLCNRAVETGNLPWVVGVALVCVFAFIGVRVWFWRRENVR